MYKGKLSLIKYVYIKLIKINYYNLKIKLYKKNSKQIISVVVFFEILDF
jgi:hypothetical protein